MAKNHRLRAALLALGFLFSFLQPKVFAQEASTTPSGDLSNWHGNILNDQGSNFQLTPRNITQFSAINPASSGGPDDYGYIWNNTIPFAWIDATTGTDTGLPIYGTHTRAITLPFSFKYYENTFSSIYIDFYGYIGFVDEDGWETQPRFPSPARPNNIIGPYITEAIPANAPFVFYMSGGTTPNRYFVVEWYKLQSGINYTETRVTFETILHENGDITFQYLEMLYSPPYSCASAGIENSTGLDGLVYLKMCQTLPSQKAVRFLRPAPAARAEVTPHIQSRFTRAGETLIFPLNIRNLGEIGSDTFNLTIDSAVPVIIYSSDGVTQLTDSDGDGMIDTGNLSPLSRLDLWISLQTPMVVNIGDSYKTTIHIASSRDPARSNTAVLQTSVPAPFAQVFLDDDNTTLGNDLIQPALFTEKKIHLDGFGIDDIIIEKPDGFAHFWSNLRDIEYAFTNKAGKITREKSNLTDNSNAVMYTFDVNPVAAVAPNGQIGVAWYRILYNGNTSYLYNIFFILLDPAGNIAYGPVNLTKQLTWDYSNNRVPQFTHPRIAASEDNHFLIAWERENWSSINYIEDIYYTVLDPNGNIIKTVTRLTNDSTNDDQFYESPGLATLTGNRMWLGWTQCENQQCNNAFVVLDSHGNLLTAPTLLPWYSYSLDAVQLSNKRILIAGESWGTGRYEIVYMLLDDVNFNVVAIPHALLNPYTHIGNCCVSVSKDLAGNAVLTWMDEDGLSRYDLFYALVDDSGSILTEPMIFQSSEANKPYIETSYEGYGNTSYNLVSPTTSSVDLQITSSNVLGAVPGYTKTITIPFSNVGLKKALSVMLSASVDARLNLVDTIPTPTTIDGNVLVWDLADMDFLGNGLVTVKVDVPSTAIGTFYPITWQITSTGPEANPNDNTVITNLMESLQLFLPAITSN